MSGALDMSLEDLISRNKRSDGGRSSFRGRGRGSGPGPARRFSDRGVNRASPYTTAKPFQARNPLWQNDMFIDRATSIETGTKLYISNLDYGVTNEDLKELFSEVGDLKRYSIHYDRSGRSKGTAEVVLSRHADAVSAVKRYNNVQLDGKPMKIEIVGTNVATPTTFPPVANSMLGNLNGVSRSWQGRRGTAGQPRGGGGGGNRGRGFGRGRGRGRGRGEQVSAEDLDTELEKYHAEAMQIN